MKTINATRGFTLVGQQPDDRGVAPSGAGGVIQVNDDPNSAVYRIPGSGGAAPGQLPDLDLPERTVADGRHYGDSYDQQLDEEAQEAMVLQGQENYDGNGTEVINGLNEQQWVDLGRRCFDAGRTYYETGWRDDHINNTYLFRGQHSPGSRYNDPVYRLRSKTFRPLTRMAARSWEADVAAALFMNDDYMTVSALNKQDNEAAEGAGVIQEVMNIRLEQMKWYATCIGAAQDAFINGPVCSKVYWKQDFGMYPKPTSLTDPITGLTFPGPIEWVTKRTVNMPVIDLILPENLLIDPKASWVDPIGTADYIVHQKMMSVQAVRRKMDMGEWNGYDDNQIMSCRWAMDDDATRNAKRGDGAPDPNDNDGADPDYENVRILEVIVRRDGCDYVYDMMGESFLLTWPQPLESRYHHGHRPFTFGTALLESHNVMPDSKTKIGAPLQHAVNEVANNRMDNVRLALNKRTVVRKGANVDLAGLTKSTPGGVVLANNVEDIKPLDIGDVTASSYQETEQLTMEMNELQGTFSAQAVANNREMNETVGGMEMLSSAATKVVDYDIRTFVNTWVEPTLRLVMLNIQYYEDDQLIIEQALGQAGKFPRLRYEELDDDFFVKQLMLKCDTGIGATNPQQRVNTLLMAVDRVAALPGMAENLDSVAVSRRIFSNVGLGTGEQFFKNLAADYEPPQQEPQEDPIVQAAREEAQGVRDAEQIRQEAENQRFSQEQETKIQIEQMRLENQREMRILELSLNAENKDKDIQSQTWWKLLDNETRLRIAEAQDKTKRQTTALQHDNSLKQEALQGVAGIAQQSTTPERLANDQQNV